MSKNDNKATPRILFNSLSEVQNLTHNLSAVGLINYDKDAILKNSLHIDDAILKVLLLYAADVKGELIAYNDIQS